MKKEVTKISSEEAKQFALSAKVTGDIEPVLTRISELLPADGNTTKELQKLISSALYAYEAESHIALLESFSERFRGGIKVICKQFISDFDCKTATEKILAETAAIAFGRYLDASRRLNNCLDVDNYITPNKTAYMAMLSKERDRAHRQYLSTVSSLKQLKAPPIDIQIKTTNAYVSQNQLNVSEEAKKRYDLK
jgi:hypothetical protein